MGGARRRRAASTGTNPKGSGTGGGKCVDFVEIHQKAATRAPLFLVKKKKMKNEDLTLERGVRGETLNSLQRRKCFIIIGFNSKRVDNAWLLYAEEKNEPHSLIISHTHAKESGGV